MSATVIRYLHCDGCGDSYAQDPMPSGRGELGTTVTEQREAASRDGWLVGVRDADFIKDFCEGCRA
jgi:hypothetical protein